MIELFRSTLDAELLPLQWIYEVRPLRDIIISSLALSLDPSTKSLPKSFNCLPSDLRDRLRRTSQSSNMR